MASSYPGGLDSFPARVDGQVIDASHVDALGDAVEAIEGTLGVNPQGASVTVAARIAALAAGSAPLDSPAFTGSPTAPTPAVDDADTSVATTAFVLGQLGSAAPLAPGTAAAGTSTRGARQDHVHPALVPGAIQTTATAAVTSTLNRYNAASGALAPALPAVGAAGAVLEVTKTDNGANPVTVGGETLAAAGDVVRFISDGTSWVSGGVRMTRSAATATYAGHRRGPSGVVCFTYDDAYQSAYNFLPYHEALGQQVTFAITSDLIGSSNQGYPYLTSAQILDVYNRGHEIANHTKSHSHLGVLTAAQRATQYDDCQTALAAITGATPTTFVVPYGQPEDFTAAIQQEIWGRFTVAAATKAVGGLIGAGYVGVQLPMAGASNFVFYRHRIDTWATDEPILRAAIARAAVEPIVVVIYGHNIGTAPGSDTPPSVSQWQSIIQLVHDLGIPAVTMSQADGRAKVADPSFEDSTLASWETAVGGTGTVTSVADTPDAGLGGSRSLRCLTAANGDYAYCAQYMPVIPGRTYTVSGRYRTSLADTTGSTVRIRTTWYGHDSVAVGSATNNTLAANTSWSRFTFDLTPDPAAVYAGFSFQYIAGATGAGFLYVDHVHFGEKRLGVFG